MSFSKDVFSAFQFAELTGLKRVITSELRLLQGNKKLTIVCIVTVKMLIFFSHSFC